MLPLFSKNLKGNFISRFRKKSPEEKEIIKFLKTHFHISPGNLNLYKKAFTHKSVVAKNISNERLEFLGDAVLDAIVSEILFKFFPNESEGGLTKYKSRIVQRSSLNELAKKTKLKSLLNHNTAGFHSSILGNAFEAIIGAIYLDKGYRKTKESLTLFFQKHIDFSNLKETDPDHKSKLINWSQREKRKLQFKVIKETGIDHNKTYTIQVFIEEDKMGVGLGKSKKSAEQVAAGKTLEMLAIT